jgi:hypothetical protein
LRRFLILGEETELARCPDWYPVFKAAQFCNCKPWELVKESVFWKDKALKALTAEAEAQEFLSNRK